MYGIFTIYTFPKRPVAVVNHVKLVPFNLNVISGPPAKFESSCIASVYGCNIFPVTSIYLLPVYLAASVPNNKFTVPNPAKYCKPLIGFV